jgi:altronate dehydratase
LLPGQGEDRLIEEGTSIIKDFQSAAAQVKRQPVSMEGFGLAVHCSGSDWTTALNGNASLGVAADHIVANRGKVFMTEWMEWSGSQHLMAEKCATYELGVELLDNLECVRETVLRETGRPVEYMNPAPGNKEGGLTTLVEKSVGTIKKVGNTQIKGLLNYCEQPTEPGVWIPKSDTVWPMSTSVYSSFAGAHVNVHVTGLGWLYFKLAYMPGVRVTGNPETFMNPEFKLDFNAGMMFDGKSLEEVGELLFEYIIRVAEGEESESEKGKSRAFNMYYYTENEFGEDTDRNQMLHCAVYEYDEKFTAYTDRVK